MAVPYDLRFPGKYQSQAGKAAVADVRFPAVKGDGIILARFCEDFPLQPNRLRQTSATIRMEVIDDVVQRDVQPGA
jgi:hypothetical protein